jgi:hypothetical protein
MRRTLLALAILVGLVAPAAAQEFPPELPPIQPSIPLFWMTIPAPVLDLPSAPPGEPIDVMLLGPSNVFTSQAEMTTYCATLQTNANNVYAADPLNPTRVRIVACLYLANYAAPKNMSTELSQIQSNRLGECPTCVPAVTRVVDVAALRDQYHADRVSLIDTGSGSCGLGYMNAAKFGKTWAFSVFDKACGATNSSAWHEWGHNDGLCHDDANASGCTPAFPYGYGFCDSAHGRRSPMVYPSPCGGTRVIFSNKDNTTTYGYPFGDATHDEAAVLRWAMPIEAAFYQSIGSVPMPRATGKPVPTQ